MNLPAWLREAWGAPADDADDPLVWLDPFHSPRNAFEERVYRTLAAGPRRRSEVVELLAEWEVRAEHAVGGWSLVAGAEALPALRPRIQADLARLDGGQVAVETPSPVRRVAQQHWALSLCA